LKVKVSVDVLRMCKVSVDVLRMCKSDHFVDILRFSLGKLITFQGI